MWLKFHLCAHTFFLFNYCVRIRLYSLNLQNVTVHFSPIIPLSVPCPVQFPPLDRLSLVAACAQSKTSSQTISQTQNMNRKNKEGF